MIPCEPGQGHDANESHSRQIRPPIYSLKQSKLRRRRVIRYSILYFVMLILFVLLLAGPLIVRRLGVINPDSLGLPMNLVQPLDAGMVHNDTIACHTGNGIPPGYPVCQGSGSASGFASPSASHT